MEIALEIMVNEPFYANKVFTKLRLMGTPLYISADFTKENNFLISYFLLCTRFRLNRFYCKETEESGHKL